MENFRKTSQYLMPAEKTEVTPGRYDIYPAFELGDDKIAEGFSSLADELATEHTVIIDGYVGVFFDSFKQNLNRYLTAKGIRAVWWDIRAAQKTEEEIDALVSPFLGGDDPIFGKRTDLTLADYFDAERLTKIQPDPQAQINLLVGCGAALAGWKGKLVYIDLPKNELQFRARAGAICNLGLSAPKAPKVMYKRFYFVDWILLNRHKKALLPNIDLLVDGQRPEEITWIKGEDLRRGLDTLASNGFRVRPWFEPGAWGGQWIREHIESLPKNVPNYAWSFELIVPENGLLFKSNNRLLEVSFDTLMYKAGPSVVGQECYRKYGDEFPIRMDYLDNFDGGNLSVQCHPRREYARRHFGEVLTQEETYYILDCKDKAVVYLGFQEDIQPDTFESALTESFKHGTPLDVNRFIQSHQAHKHDLYLIPPGTLHSSGRNNLVLEISTTPYIFTFKMYDWLSLDLDGTPRPLNIQRAMENLYFNRCGEKVKQELISHPRLLEKGEDWELWHLPTHPDHSYDIHRYCFNTSVEVKTEGKCHVLNLVEGEKILVETAGGVCQQLSYAETYVIPAAANSYRLINQTDREVQVVKAFMK